MTHRSLSESARILVAVALLPTAAGGCAVGASRPVLVPVNPLADVTALFRRVLVAGFVSTPVGGVDANVETSRLLRQELRTDASVQVVDMQPLQLESHVLADVPYWRRLGEEYREPLIVTGVVDFKSMGPYYEERSAGRRTLPLWLPQFSLAVRLLLIDGATGELIASSVCGPTIARGATARERVLGLYHRLMDRTMPSILTIFGRRTALRSASMPQCRGRA